MSGFAKRYWSISVLLGLLLVFLLSRGTDLRDAARPAPEGAPDAVTHALGAPDVAEFFVSNANRPISVLFTQLITIIVGARLLGMFFQRLGQPPVTGEMLAGIALGPSLLGAAFPAFTAAVFPESSLGALKLLSQFGVVLYMFLVGLEFDPADLRQHGRTACFVSHLSILFQMCVGVSVGMLVYPELAGPSAGFLPFVLFLGVTLSISAFPVLARILAEKGFTATRVGKLTLAAALIDELTAWSVVAVVNTLATASSLFAALVGVGASMTFILFLLFIVRPLFNRIYDATRRFGFLDAGSFAVVILFLLGTALVTRVLGVHVFVGAFIAGMVLPRRKELQQFLHEKLHPFTSVILLPLFFAFTGLRTDLTSLANITGGAGLVFLILVASCGKLASVAAAARMTGEPWPVALRLGTLMNTRGMMELIIINVGYDLGLFSQRLFSVLVLMALTTTFLTGPLLQLLHYLSPYREPAIPSTLDEL